MSADVWIETPTEVPTVCRTCGHEPEDNGQGRGAALNVTYNLSRMLAAGGFCGWQAIIGQPAREVGEHILTVLDAMRVDDDKWRAMNPSNGWGDYDDCLQGRMRAWAQECVEAGPGDVIGGWL